jgi:hypothetical protein
MDQETPHREVEDFEKIIEIPSNQFAIVDADVVRHLQVPNAKDAVFITTKRSGSEKNLRFKITGRYDDASLRELKIEPAMDDPAPEAPIQAEAAITGNDKGIDKAIRKHTSVKGLRRNRNKKYSKYGGGVMDQPNPTQRIVPRRNGAKNSNYGQPRKGKPDRQSIINCAVDSVNAVKHGGLKPEIIAGIQHKHEVKKILGEMLTRCVQGDTKIRPHFDAIYEVYSALSSTLSESLDREVSSMENLVLEWCGASMCEGCGIDLDDPDARHEPDCSEMARGDVEGEPTYEEQENDEPGAGRSEG